MLHALHIYQFPDFHFPLSSWHEAQIPLVGDTKVFRLPTKEFASGGEKKKANVFDS